MLSRTTFTYKTLMLVALIGMIHSSLAYAKHKEDSKSERNICKELLVGVAAAGAGRVVSFAMSQAGFSQNRSLAGGAVTALLVIIGLASSDETVDKRSFTTKTAAALVTFAGSTYVIPVNQGIPPSYPQR